MLSCIYCDNGLLCKYSLTRTFNKAIKILKCTGWLRKRTKTTHDLYVLQMTIANRDFYFYGKAFLTFGLKIQLEKGISLG